MEQKSTCLPLQEKKNVNVTGLKVNNSLSPGRLVEFIPKDGRRVNWYLCGPTVYDDSHIGDARTYLSFDMILKVMRIYFKYDVTICMSIIDIDEKIFRRSNEEGEDFSSFAKKWEANFFEDMKKLNVDLPDIITRVSENLPEIIRFIQRILHQGYAYESNGSVYFDTKAYKQSEKHVYGKLESSVRISQEQYIFWEEGSFFGNAENSKKSSTDFLLWRKSQLGEPKWASPWGEGRPGWHVECSTMANSVFGTSADIYTGGRDLKFPHHENGIALIEAFYDNYEGAGYFIHTGFLSIYRRKMAMTLRFFKITVKNLLEKYTARQVRLLFLMHKYDSDFEYIPETEESELQFMRIFLLLFRNMRESMHQILDVERRHAEFFFNIKAYLRTNPITKTQIWLEKEFGLNKIFAEKKEAVHQSFCNNFDTPAVISHIEQLISATNFYMNRPDPKFSLLLSLAFYISFIFECMGIVYDNKFSRMNQNQEIVDIEELVAPILDNLSNLRDKVRNAARKKACDELRDDTLPFLNEHKKIKQKEK